MFDAPLIKVADGSYLFFAPAYHTPVLGQILLSRLAWLNRQRDSDGKAGSDNAFEDKGKTFEKRIVKLFSDCGLQARGFAYTIDGVDYDCDAAVIIGRSLFIFECKNRSLPLGHVSSLYYFERMLNAAGTQVKRIVSQFTADPQLVRGNFGPGVTWDRIVPVVVSALPWSAGRRDDVYYYDGSALAQMLIDGFTSVAAEFAIGDHRFVRRHKYLVRRNVAPTAEELEAQMANSNQVRLHSIGWSQSSNPVQVSDDVAFAFPEWTQREASLEEQMIALGSSKEEAERLVREMSETIPAALKRVREKSTQGVPIGKIPRNSQCPCGSGKKYKKCCFKP